MRQLPQIRPASTQGRKLTSGSTPAIYGFKLGLTMDSPDEEYGYAFKVVKALGANQLTMEMPDGNSALVLQREGLSLQAFQAAFLNKPIVLLKSSSAIQ